MDDPKPLRAWSAEFGDCYTARNVASPEQVRGRMRVWSSILDRMAGAPPASALEVGPNIGLNLRALAALSAMDLWAIEPNPAARDVLIQDKVLTADHLYEGFGHQIPIADGAVDLAFTCGVLIYVDPSLLEVTMREIHRVSARYIFCAEYFAPKAETLSYRGEEGLLFRNDFGSLYLDGFPDLELVDYGFFWRRASVMDDTVWWLFRKT